ncbi:hypothetical protein [Paraburkholderia sp. Cpub6]|uniref:hypothetical protein n=1 Tax=Paraburkholderia sp. Cpub6 TaxID=2723094 RepID=UPI0016136F54|nr:hypothetical protein [Paraburkholderia sp. Cpub6]MBB5462182.1 formyltetrahydrofolate synthetase [Paraburkholderia sp. Cpub6]
MFDERARVKTLQFAQAHPWRRDVKRRNTGFAVTAATHVVSWRTLIQTVSDFLLNIGDAAFTSAVSTRPVLLAQALPRYSALTMPLKFSLSCVR